MIIKNTKKSVFPVYRGRHVKVILSASPYTPPTPGELPQNWNEAASFTWNGLGVHTWGELTT